MAGNPWDRVRDLFREACERPAAERAAYLDDACGGDAELRAEVQSLLEARDSERSSPGVAPGHDETASVARPRNSSPPREDAGSVIGRYKLLQLIGEGGFGSVYMAEQQEPVRRKVALKIIKLGMDTKQVIARFEAERQALALMDHPHIARVLDAGATETGRPYFVMELVRGVPITEYCDQNNLSTKQRLELFLSVCSAVQHAHQKGIIHRDLKPSNVMVTLHDGVPVPKVIDFGIAKAMNQRLTEKTLFTEYRQFIGTPQYMSPEQAEMSGLDIDTRSDIYSLGVLLYELLTGTTPFDPERLRSLAYTEIHRVIREEEPHKPSTRVSTLGQAATNTAKRRATDARTLRRTLSGDLDWIVMKALEKDRTRRYETANGLLLDIRRHLDNEPVLAGPPRPTYRLKKLMRRHRTAVTVTGAVAAALILGLALATYGFVEANRERAAARREAESAEAINTFFNQMLASVDPRQSHLYSAFGRAAMAPDVSAQFDHGVSVVDMLRRATGRIETSFAGKPELEALARETIGTTFLGLDATDEAVDEFKKALAVRRDVLGGDHPEVQRSRLHVATALVAAGRVNEAQGFAVEALAGLEQQYGTDHPLTLSAASLRATIHSEQGEMARADSLFEITLERQRRALGSEHRDTIATLLAWAGAYCWRGRGQEATELSGEAYETASRIYSPDDAIVLEAERVYGLALTFRRQTNRAKEILRPSIEKCRRVCGENHSATLWAGFSLARALELPEEQEEQESLYAKIRDTNGPSEWVVCRDLGRLMLVRGKLEEGLAVLREQHEYWNGSVEEVANHVRRERLGIIQQQAYSHYREALADAGRWQEVRALVKDRIDQLRAEAVAPGAGPTEWNECAWLLLTCEPADLRDPEEALVWATRALERRGSADQVVIGLVYDTQARAFEMLGDLDHAIEAQRHAIEAVAAADAEVTGSLTAELARYLSEDAEEPGAVAAVIEAIVDSLDVKRTDPASSVEALRWLGQDLADRGLHSWAEEPFRRAIKTGRGLSEKLPLLRSLIGFGSSRARAGDMDEVRTLLDEARVLYREIFAGEPIDWRPGIGYDDTGERSPDAVDAKRDLALALIDAERLEAADELISQVAAVNHASARHPFGRLRLAERDPAAAEPLLRTSLLLARLGRMAEEVPYRFARREIEYGQCLIELGRSDEAREILARAHARALEWGGPRSADTELAAELLEKLHQVRGQADAAPGRGSLSRTEVR